MKVDVESIEKNIRTLSIEVPAEEFGKSIANAFVKLNRKANIPGFRKGKAPRFIFERYYGKDVIINEALDDLIPRGYYEAVKETGIEPVAPPEIEILDSEEGKPLVFKAKVTVRPEVELCDYKNHGIQRGTPTVTDEQVEERILELRKNHATLEDVDEGTVEKGSIVIINYQGSVEGGKILPGGEGVYVEIGNDTLQPEFEQQLLGARMGETREIRVTLPENDGDELSGKEAVFQVTVQSIKKRVLPELTDEFVARVTPYKSVQELKDALWNTLLNLAKRRAEDEFRSRVISKITEESGVDIPEVMIEQEIEELVKEAADNLKRYDITLEKFLSDQKKTESEFREELRPRAEKNVKTGLVLDAIASAEGIEVSEAEIETAMSQIAQSIGQKPDAVRQLLMMRGRYFTVKSDIVRYKALNLLLSTPEQEESCEEAEVKGEESVPGPDSGGTNE
ncbi:MAG: trigger factor [Bacillota bacterium]